MRRSRCSVICAGLASRPWRPSRASAAGVTSRREQRRLADRPPVAGPSRAAAPAAPDPSRETHAACSSQTWHQFEFGGRFSSVSATRRGSSAIRTSGTACSSPTPVCARRSGGQPGRSRRQRTTSAGAISATSATSAPGRFVVSGLWDEIPQFYSVDTKTPYTGSGGTLVLDDATQRAIQNGQANAQRVHAAGAAVRPARAARHRRRALRGDADAAARRDGQLHDAEARRRAAVGASFGFSNDVEVALPYDSRANDFTLGTEWTNAAEHASRRLHGSWFDNLDDTLVWDSPLRLDDSTSAPGRGRMALWPSNSAQTISVAGYTKFARKTQLTGFISFGSWSNDEPLQPFTINATLPQLALPARTPTRRRQVFSTNLNLVSRPVDRLAVQRAAARVYDYNNQTPHAAIPEFINYDTSVKTSSTGGPELYAHSRTTFDADATWSGLSRWRVTVGYTRNNGGYDFRIFESTARMCFRLTADAVGSQWSRSGRNTSSPIAAAPASTRPCWRSASSPPCVTTTSPTGRGIDSPGRWTSSPTTLWTFSASTGFGKDDYDDSYFGLQESTFRTFSLGADFRQPNGLGAQAQLQLRALRGAISDRGRRAPDQRRRKTIRTATGPRTRRSA